MLDYLKFKAIFELEIYAAFNATIENATVAYPRWLLSDIITTE